MTTETLQAYLSAAKEAKELATRCYLQATPKTIAMTRLLSTTTPQLADAVAALVAEVERLQTPATFGKTILDMIETHCNRDDLPNEDEADGALNAWLRMRAARDEAIADKEREYARGREDERAAIVAYIDRDYYADDLAQDIERGEHVGEVKNGQ